MKQVLTFLNLLDNGGNLSITNVAVLICLYKIAASAQFSGTEVGALIATLMNYAHKRLINSGGDDA